MTEGATSDVGRVDVGAAAGDYPVLVGAGLLAELPALLGERCPAARYALVTDDNVERHHTMTLAERCREAGLEVERFVFPAGEVSKSRDVWAALTDRMLAAGFGRDSCVVAVGGGVTTDLGGFVAATFMRGLPLVQVPTSYLAMIDASVGGKTGVDVPAGKNLVGAFHPPRMVVVDTATLATLPREERAQGLVEAVKHGAILDVRYFADLAREVDALLDARPAAAHTAVLRSVELKAAVVTQDEREGGYRQILNFGHTVGHAIEAASEFRIGHGSAVALGMVAEAAMGEVAGVTRTGTAARLREVLDEVVETWPTRPPIERVLPYLATDKKARGGRPRYVLLRDIGEVDPGGRWTHELPDALVADALRGL